MPASTVAASSAISRAGGVVERGRPDGRSANRGRRRSGGRRGPELGGDDRRIGRRGAARPRKQCSEYGQVANAFARDPIAVRSADTANTGPFSCSAILMAMNSANLSSAITKGINIPAYRAGIRSIDR